MGEKNRIYFCIDMKSFFASVECAERGLNPFETNLVVADETRGRGALCLAVTPKMKALGVSNRGRLFEIPSNIEYIIARPRMKKYIEYAADIYSIYLDYISKDDIHVYSIDEAFIDATDYLKLYKMEPMQFAKLLVDRIALVKHIPATAGVGTNLYLAKIALDITAKKTPEHMGYLDEELFCKTLWKHRPITDFWQIARGTAARLERMGIFDMQGIADAPEALLYKVFGINAELLIDHSKGKESCTIADIKNYKGKSKSISSSQILFEDYPFEKARIVINEMALNGCQEMMRRHVICNRVDIYIGYSRDTVDASSGGVKMKENTNVFSIVGKYVLSLFDKIAERGVLIRRLGICFNSLSDECCEGYDLFTDFEAVRKEKLTEEAVLSIKDKFGKNAIIRAMDLQEGATSVIRNKLIGGHNGE